MPVVGFVNPQSPDGHAGRLRGLRQGLKDTGRLFVKNAKNPETRSVKPLDIAEKPPFRTFQVCPKDLRTALRQIEAAED
jgi:hypothetical protein